MKKKAVPVSIPNGIKGVTDIATWVVEYDEQNVHHTIHHIALHCSIDTATVFLGMVVEGRHWVMNILSDDDDPDTAWCELFSYRYPSLPEMEAELLRELEESGLLSQNHQRTDEGETLYLKPESKKGPLCMDWEKFQMLKAFGRSIWKERIESFKREGWEDERTRGFPRMSGNEFSGSLYYENHSKFPAIDVLSVEWQAWRMKIVLDLHDHGKIQVKSTRDIENKPFMHDNIIRALLS